MIKKNYGMLILLLRLFMMFKKNVNHGFSFNIPVFKLFQNVTSIWHKFYTLPCPHQKIRTLITCTEARSKLVIYNTYYGSTPPTIAMQSTCLKRQMLDMCINDSINATLLQCHGMFIWSCHKINHIEMIYTAH